MKTIVTTLALLGCSLCATANENAPAPEDMPPPPEQRERPIPPKAMEMAERTLARFDADGSGELNAEELARVLHHLRKKQGERDKEARGEGRPPKPPKGDPMAPKPPKPPRD